MRLNLVRSSSFISQIGDPIVFRLAVVIFLALEFGFGFSHANAASVSPESCKHSSHLACQTAAGIGLGINIENPLARQSDGSFKSRLAEIQLQEICHRFTSVRLPFRLIDDDGKPDLKAIAAAKVMAQSFVNCGLIVVVDNHFFDFFEPGKNLKNIKPKDQFKKLWSAIAKEFKNSNNKILLELLNEPSNKADAREMNLAYSEAIAEIRKVGAKNLIVVGPTKWGSPRALEFLELPADPDLIVGVHVYDPMEFTHQGAQWIQPPFPLGLDCCTKAQIATFSGWLKLASDWSKKNGRPVVVTEYGVYEKAKFESREKYLREFTKAATELGLSRMYWEYDNGFGLYDPKSSRWNSSLMKAIGAKSE